MPSPLGSYNDPELEKRLPFDRAAGEEAAGRGRLSDGFEVTLDCPNNRYINDEEICIAVAAMWAQIEREGHASTRCRARPISRS